MVSLDNNLLCFLQSVGPCVRCSVINVDQSTGDRGSKLLTTLATFRREQVKGQVAFGLLLSQPRAQPFSVAGVPDTDGADAVVSPRLLPWICVGDLVTSL